MAIPTIQDLRNRPFFNGSAAWGQNEYTDWIDESMSWKTTCYVGDWSWLEPGLSIGGSFESDDIGDWYRDPVELGWGNRIKFDHEFIGRKALEEIVAHPKRTSVTLVWNREDVKDVYASLFEKGELYDPMDLPRNWRWQMRCDKVLKEGKPVGIATSRGYSVYFRQMLSLCVIDLAHALPGTDVVVIWGSPGKRQK